MKMKAFIKKQCEKLSNLKDTNAELFKKKSKKYGINNVSSLLNLDLCSGADMMHDVLEGVLEYETKRFLCYSIDDQSYFTYKQLLEGFELGMPKLSNPNLKRNLKEKRQLVKSKWYTCIR